MKIWISIIFFILASQVHAQLSDFDGINFQKADRMALECKADGLDNMPNLVHNLTSQLSTDVEKFRAIYRWVSSNVANDYRLYEKNMRKRHRFKNDSLKLKVWNDKFRRLSFETLLKKRKTICTGYAYLVKELSRLADINCEVINGYAKTSIIAIETLDIPNHSWNAVELDGKWYLCDPTWASGTPNADNFQFEFNYNDGYFLTRPELFAINHYPVETQWLLFENNAPTFEDFLESPVFYGKAYTNLSSYNEPIKMHNTIRKHEIVTFRCQLQNTVDSKEITLVLDNGNSSHQVHPDKTSIENKTLVIEYAFDSNGLYDVHLMIGDDLISSYTFRVKG